MLNLISMFSEAISFVWRQILSHSMMKPENNNSVPGVKMPGMLVALLVLVICTSSPRVDVEKIS